MTRPVRKSRLWPTQPFQIFSLLSLSFQSLHSLLSLSLFLWTSAPHNPFRPLGDLSVPVDRPLNIASPPVECQRERVTIESLCSDWALIGVGHLTPFISSQGLKLLESEADGLLQKNRKLLPLMGWASWLSNTEMALTTFMYSNNQNRTIYNSSPQVKCTIQLYLSCFHVDALNIV